MVEMTGFVLVFKWTKYLVSLVKHLNSWDLLLIKLSSVIKFVQKTLNLYPYNNVHHIYSSEAIFINWHRTYALGTKTIFEILSV